MGYGHPECPERLEAIYERLSGTGFVSKLEMLEAPPASIEQLSRVHDRHYIERVHQLAPEEGSVMLDPDTSMCRYSLSAALHAAGALILATDEVLGGGIDRSFCAVRPPGHHATRGAAMGFCIFNNIAVGAAHALHRHGLEKVAILDFDVHHGNGTQDIFAGNKHVLFCSIHQHPHYPYTGAPAEFANIVNVPLAAGAGTDEFRLAVTNHWLPAINSFAPEIIYCSAGFDAHQEDQLSDINLLDDDYGWISEEIVKLANTHCKGRVISTLEGGYALDALARSVCAHIGALLHT
jgi:acetoin utilization deacetylase AcuC-like enzyme